MRLVGLTIIAEQCSSCSATRIRFGVEGEIGKMIKVTTILAQLMLIGLKTFPTVDFQIGQACNQRVSGWGANPAGHLGSNVGDENLGRGAVWIGSG